MSLQDDLLAHIQSPGYQPRKFRELADDLGLSKADRPALKTALNDLIAAGRIRRHPSGDYSAAVGPGLIAGIVRKTARGSGIFRPHEQIPGQPLTEMLIPEADMLDASTGDEVLIRLLKRRGRDGKRLGKVVEIIERQTSTFVGTYFEQLGQGYVQVDGRTFNEPIYVGDPGAKGARPEDKVVFDMLRFPTPRRQGEGVITRVLGPRGETEVDTMSIIYQFGLPFEFSDKVHEDARRQADQFDENDLSDREDLTGTTIITIDPIDARDFDDAISLEKNEAGHWVLGVHIADVAHFVKPRSPLDIEAQKRGTSVYLPQKVIPMLPELISNGLASLQEGKLRYTKSAFIELTPDGIPVSTRLANTAIKVTHRFAYEQVLPLLESGEKGRQEVGPAVFDLVADMRTLARVLRQRRHEKGMLELTMGEVKLDFDTEGKVIGAHDVHHDESHQMIEEFMLAANIAVAQELTDRKILFLRRVHADPDELKLRAYAEFVQTLGFDLKHFQSREALQNLLQQAAGQPAERAVNYGLLRSLKQAEYSRFEVGHYALAEEHYCHFTSPIRRYPDLTVHRIVDAIVRRKRRPRETSEEELVKLGKHCSQTERRAEKAERELTKLKLLRYMAERIGDELDAIITGVENFGFFCQGVEIPVEGLVHVRRLESGEYFDYDAKAHALIGRSSGTRYRLGAPVRIKVVKVDVDRRELDFDLVSEGTPSGKGGNRKPRPNGNGGKAKTKGKQKGKKKGKGKGKVKGKAKTKPDKSEGGKRKKRRKNR